MEIQDYTDSEFKHALARNLRSLTRGKKSSKQPIAILLGGQSGAGKKISGNGVPTKIRQTNHG